MAVRRVGADGGRQQTAVVVVLDAVGEAVLGGGPLVEEVRRLPRRRPVPPPWVGVRLDPDDTDTRGGEPLVAGRQTVEMARVERAVRTLPLREPGAEGRRVLVRDADDRLVPASQLQPRSHRAVMSLPKGAEVAVADLVQPESDAANLLARNPHPQRVRVVCDFP